MSDATAQALRSASDKLKSTISIKEVLKLAKEVSVALEKDSAGGVFKDIFDRNLAAVEAYYHGTTPTPGQG